MDSAITAEFSELENSSPLKDELRMMLKAPTLGRDGANTKRPAVTSAAFICLCTVESIPRIYENISAWRKIAFTFSQCFFLHLLDVINQVISACKSHPEYKKPCLCNRCLHLTTSGGQVWNVLHHLQPGGVGDDAD